MLQNGFIKIDRKITSWRWYHDSNTFRLFFHLILTANYEDKPFENIIVKRGQRVASYSTLAIETGLSVRNLRTALSHLISTGEVTVERHNKYSVISVNNYNKYQGTDKQTDKRPTSNRQATDNNERKIKKDKERKEYQSSIGNGSESFQHSFQQSEKDRRTDDKKQEYINISFSEVLERINSPLAGMGYQREEDMNFLDEERRAVSSCIIPYDLKENKSAFRTALRYLMAYSYRMPEEDREIQNFADTVIDCITELVSVERVGQRVIHYYEVINCLNEIIKCDSLYDWLCLFLDKWEAVCREKQRRNDPIKNKKLYMKPFIYDFLKDYKIEETYPEFDYHINGF